MYLSGWISGNVSAIVSRLSPYLLNFEKVGQCAMSYRAIEMISSIVFQTCSSNLVFFQWHYRHEVKKGGHFSSIKQDRLP